MIEEIRKSTALRRRWFHNVYPGTGAEAIGIGACDDIDTLLALIEKIEKWIDNPHYDAVDRLRRVEVEIRGIVTCKGPCPECGARGHKTRWCKEPKETEND